MDRRIDSHIRTERFLREAFRDGAHVKLMPLRGHQKLKTVLDAVGLYYGQRGASFEDVGLMLDPIVTGESARKYTKLGMAAIWNAASSETQESYPLDRIPIAKPAKGRIKELDQDATATAVTISERSGASYNEIQQETGLSGKKITAKRGLLRKQGVEIPYKHLSPHEYADLVRMCSDPDISEETFKSEEHKISLEVAKHMAFKRVGVLSLTETAKRCGYAIKTRALKPVKEAFSEAGILLARKRVLMSGADEGLVQVFFFVAERYLDQGQRILEGIPSIEKYKI